MGGLNPAAACTLPLRPLLGSDRWAGLSVGHTSMTSQSCRMSLRDGGTSTCTESPLGDAWAVSAMRLRRPAICSAVSCRPVQQLMYDTLTSRFWLSRFGHTAQHEACWTDCHGLQQCTSMALWDVKQQQCIFALNRGKASPYTDSKLSALSLQSAGLHHALHTTSLPFA